MINVILDLEMNAVSMDATYEKVRRICKTEIMEIGAVALDEKGAEVSRFMTYVKPAFNSVIEENYTKLTGITTEMVADAPGFAAGFRQFSNWCQELGEEIYIYAWSDCDLVQVTREMEQKKYKVNAFEKQLLKNWKDFQKIFEKKIGFDRAISLSDALNYAGFDFEGRQHDALFDAINTAELFRICNDQKLFDNYLKVVKEAMETTTIGSSMGDLLSGLNIHISS